MEPINNTTKYAVDLLNITHTSPINLIPQEVISLIISNLNDRSIQLCSIVDKSWSAASIDAGRSKELKEIYFGVELVSNYLDKQNSISPDEKNIGIMTALAEYKQCKIPGFNLQLVKLASENAKEKILNILKNLDMNVLDALDDLDLNQQTDLFDIAEIYKKIENIENSEAYPLVKIKDLSEQRKYLLIFKQFNKAVEVSKKIPHDLEPLLKALNKAPMFKSINPLLTLLENLIISKNNDQIESLAHYRFNKGKLASILNQPDTKQFFEKFCKFTYEKNDFLLKYPAFVNILGELLNHKGSDYMDVMITEQAIKIANDLPSNILIDISMTLLKNGKKEEAIDVAMQIKESNLRESSLAEIKPHDNTLNHDVNNNKGLI